MKRTDLPWVLGAGIAALLICLFVLGAILVRTRAPQAATSLDGTPDGGGTPAPAGTAALPATLPVTTSPGTPWGHIVYTCQLAGDQICIMGADGADMRQLTFDPVRHWYPSIAPEGGSVVFSAYREDNVYEIYELDFFGTRLQLTDRLGVAKAPEVSPDGRRIVFGLSDAAGTESIWLMDRDGGNPHELHSPGWDPTWSPDGGRVLFASLDANNSIQLFTIGADGSGLAQVTHLNNLRGRSDWSPDGRWMATYAGEPWEREIFLFGPDGSGLVQFTSGGNTLAPSFSPDGTWVAMTSYRDRYGVDTGCEIYVTRIADAYTLRLTYNDYCDWQPRWGP